MKKLRHALCGFFQMPPCQRPHVTLRAAAIRLELSDATAYAAAAYLTQYSAALAAVDPAAGASGSAGVDGANGVAAGSSDEHAGGGAPRSTDEHAGSGAPSDGAVDEGRVGACLFLASKVCARSYRLWHRPRSFS